MMWATALMIVSTLSYAVYVSGSSGGITGVTQLNGNGCECHGSASPNVNVTISGPDTVLIGSTNTYSVTITGGPLVRGGTNIAASTGMLNIVAESGLQKIGNELTHAAPKIPTDGNVRFQFTYTAPTTTGQITLYANGNSVNLNGSSSGDQWNFAPNKTIVVSATSSANDRNRPAGFDLAQNYPNPFNPSTTIRFTLPQDDFIRLNIFDATGKVIQTVLNGRTSRGTHEVQINAATFASGAYFYRLETSTYSETKKMLFIK